jgi:hypothetical protein
VGSTPKEGRLDVSTESKSITIEAAASVPPTSDNVRPSKPAKAKQRTTARNLLFCYQFFVRVKVAENEAPRRRHGEFP